METSHSDINPNVPSAVADPEKAETPSPMLTKEGPDPSSEGEQSADTTTPAKGRTIIGVRWFFVCLGIFSANLLYGLDTTIAADIQAAVSETYDNVTQLGWLGIGFGLGSTVAILPLGKMYGVFDNKWLYLSCLLMFSAGSALCGAAPSMNALIIGRVWAGAGGAGMYLGYVVIESTIMSPELLLTSLHNQDPQHRDDHDDPERTGILRWLPGICVRRRLHPGADSGRAAGRQPGNMEMGRQ
jgi:hypothetical protein